MLQECVHSGGISCMYRQGSMDLGLQMPGIMHDVIWPLLQYYYKQCYLACNIRYESILILLYQTYFNPHNIFCFNVCLQKCVAFGNKLHHVDI